MNDPLSPITETDKRADADPSLEGRRWQPNPDSCFTFLQHFAQSRCSYLLMNRYPTTPFGFALYADCEHFLEITSHSFEIKNTLEPRLLSAADALDEILERLKKTVSARDTLAVCICWFSVINKPDSNRDALQLHFEHHSGDASLHEYPVRCSRHGMGQVIIEPRTFKDADSIVYLPRAKSR